MNWSRTVLMAALGATVWAQAPARQTPPPPSAPRPFAFPKPAVKKLANGLTVYAVEDHRLPLVSYSLQVMAGSGHLPAAQAGLANLAAGLLREGTITRNAQQIARLVDNAGGSLGASAGDDSTSISAGFMKSYADLGLELLADITMNPKFDQEEIERNVRQLLSGLQVSYSDVSSLRDLAAGRALLGTHPYAYPNEGTPETVRNLKRDDLLAFHLKHFVPANAFLGVAGDLTPEEAFAKAEKYFGNWKGGPAPAEKLAATPAPAARVVVIDMPGAVQTQIGIGHSSIARNHPDWLPMSIANQVFGGSFNSRLNMKIRANEGLTYGATSHPQGMKYGGVFMATTFTRTEKTAQAVQMIVDLFKEWKANPATDAEFQTSQRFLASSFGLSVETAGAVAGRVLSSAVFGLGEDYWPTYQQKILALTRQQVETAVKRHIQPERLVVVAAGNAKEFAKQLEKFGPVTVIAATDFDPVAAAMKRAPEAVTKSAASAAQAQRLVAAAVAAMGGREALARIRDHSSMGALKLHTPQGELAGDSSEEVLYPDKYKAVLNLPIGRITQASDGTTAWMSQGGMTRELPPQGRAELEKSVRSAAAIGLLREALEGKAEVNGLAATDINGQKHEALEWQSGDYKVKLMFEPGTGLPVRMVYRGMGMSGPAEIETSYADWREVAGVRLPYKETVFQNGAKFLERVVSVRQLNPGLNAAIFKKPN